LHCIALHCIALLCFALFSFETGPCHPAQAGQDHSCTPPWPPFFLAFCNIQLHCLRTLIRCPYDSLSFRRTEWVPYAHRVLESCHFENKWKTHKGNWLKVLCPSTVSKFSWAQSTPLRYPVSKMLTGSLEYRHDFHRGRDTSRQQLAEVSMVEGKPVTHFSLPYVIRVARSWVLRTDSPSSAAGYLGP
jgi:hypothetical protein